MAFHKVLLPDSSISLHPAINRGLCYQNYKLYLFGGYTGTDYSDKLQIYNLRLNT